MTGSTILADLKERFLPKNKTIFFLEKVKLQVEDFELAGYRDRYFKIVQIGKETNFLPISVNIILNFE
jgi:hypothetical protein